MPTLTAKQKDLFSGIEATMRYKSWNSEKSVPSLARLLANPNSTSSDTESDYQLLQTYLLSEDIVLRNIAKTAISVAILNSNENGKKYAHDFREGLLKDYPAVRISKRHLYDIHQLTGYLWQAWCAAIEASRANFLDLNDNSLEKLDADRWTELCNAIKKSNFIQLDLGSNDLGKLDEIRWKAFCNAIQDSKIRELQLALCKLGLLHVDDWKIFCDAIEKSNLRSLSLHGNALEIHARQWQWQTLFQAIQRSTLDTLFLGHTELWQLEIASWQALGKALTATNLISLDLQGNKLAKMSDDCWQAFCDAIQNSNLKTLNLTRNGLNTISKSRWEALMTAIQKSKITFLSLGDNNLSLHPERYQDIIAILNDNFQLKIEGLQGYLPDALYRLLDRNEHINQACQQTLEAIKLQQSDEAKFMKLVDPIIAKLSKSLSLLDGINTPNANSTRQQLQNYLDGLQICQKICTLSPKVDTPTGQVQTELDELNYKKGCFLRDNFLNDLEIDKIVAPWLAISSQNPSLLEKGRMEAFQLVFDTIRASDNPHSAFIAAMPCCVGDQDKFTLMDDANWILFDRILFEAVGGKGIPNERLLETETRLALLQNILLLDIQKTCETPTSNDPTTLLEIRRSQIIGMLENELPTLVSGQMNEQTKQDISNLWTAVNEKLQTTPLLDNNQKLMVAAINHLTPEMSERPVKRGRV